MTSKELLPQEGEIIESEETKSSTPKLLWIVVIALFLSLLGASGAAYWFYDKQFKPLAENLAEQRDISTQLVAVKDGERQVRSLVGEIKQTNTVTTTALQQLKSDLAAQTQRMNTLNADIAKLSGARAGDWLIAEADYLTRMAGRKLWLEEDTQTAILLLREADNRLEETADPTLLAARKSIASDIQGLQQVNTVNTVDIALTLAGIISTIDTLPINALALPDVKHVKSAALSDNTKDWKANLSKVWDSLMEDFITIEKRSAAVSPMMNQAQRFLVTERLKLSLQQAQYAALHHQAELLQNALHRATEITQQHYQQDAAAVTGLLTQLQQLKQVNIEKQLPQTLQSNQVLQGLIQQRIAFANDSSGNELE